jgi:hypothetical protein
MNKFFTILFFMCIALWSNAQDPSFKYQGVARNAQNASLNNQNIALRLSILNAANSTVYSEVHNVTTSAIGIFSVNVCQGTNKNGTCGAIDWSAGGFQLKVDMDPAGGAVFMPMGTSPILAVPVAAYALKAQSAVQGDADSNPQNELQNLTFTPGTNNLAISQGNNVDLTALKNDADADPSNEIQMLSLDTTNNELSLSRNGGTIVLPGAGASLWKKNGNVLSYTAGNQSISFDNVGATPKPAYFEIDFRSNAKRRIQSNSSEWSDEFWTKPANAVGKEIAYGSSVIEYPTTIAQHYLRFNLDTFFFARISNTLNGASKSSVSNELVLLNQGYNGNTAVKILGVVNSAFDGVGQIYNAVGGRPGGVITAANVNNTVTPYVGLFNPNNSSQLIGGLFIQAGQSVLNANVKNFSMDHPKDPTKEIWYACIEGPEAAAYERGTATLVNGEAFIPFTEHFELVINPSTMTVNITPGSAESEGIAVIEKTAKGIRVKELRQGKGNYSFDWEAKAVRKGYEDYKTIRTKGVDTPVPVRIPSSVPEINEAFDQNSQPVIRDQKK